MKLAKSVLASLVATGLVAAPVVAQAAPVRASSDVTQAEDMAGGSALLYLGLLAAVAFLIFVVADEDSFDDVDDLPRSP